MTQIKLNLLDIVYVSVDLIDVKYQSEFVILSKYVCLKYVCFKYFIGV